MMKEQLPNMYQTPPELLESMLQNRFCLQLAALGYLLTLISPNIHRRSSLNSGAIPLG